MGTSLRPFFSVVSVLSVALAPAIAQERPIRVPLDPRITADGTQVLFVWQGDVWIAPLDGESAGSARRLTIHPGDDSDPVPSPDGRTIVFRSDRAGAMRLFSMAVDGSDVHQLTTDSFDRSPLAITADGRALITRRATDRSPFGPEAGRAFALPLGRKGAERMVLDAGLVDFVMAPSGTMALFVRGRIEPWRKGYRGSAAMQIWLADFGDGSGAPAITRLSSDRERFQNVSERDPMWSPDGTGYWFVSDPDGTAEVFWRALSGGAAKQVTHLGADGNDDGVLFPSVSRDGRRMVFQRGFDLLLLDVATGETRGLSLRARGDDLVEPVERRRVRGADDVAFTADGKQMAFVAGQDIYVMDRVLKDPVRVTNTIAVESSPLFGKDGKHLWFVSEEGGEVDIWEATCPREDLMWWRAAPLSLPLRKLTDDAAVESSLALSPSGDRLAYVKGGDLYVMNTDGSDPRRVLSGWDAPAFDWSPDGKWICFSREDDDFNDDVWIVPLDGSRPPFNLSRHPDDDTRPLWSPDGARIAWTGVRDDGETDIFIVTLAKEADEQSSRDRKLEKAIEAMAKKPAKKPEGKKDDAKGDEPKKDEPAAESDKSRKDKKDVVVDFDGIHERVRRIEIAQSSERDLLWSPDGKRLAFSARVNGESGLFTVGVPDELTPKKAATSALSSARWIEDGDQILGLSSGAGPGPNAGPPGQGGGRMRGGAGRSPASLDVKGGKLETFGFDVADARDWRDLRRLAFDQGWRAMRDRFYDGNLNGRDWNAVRARYRAVAGELIGRDEFSRLMNMMLGELNASHMGHRGSADPLPRPGEDGAWSPRTFHPGVRLDDRAQGPGVMIESVIPRSPAAQARSLLRKGERILAVDGTAVDDVTAFWNAMTFADEHDVVFSVRAADGAERSVTLRPMNSANELLYDEWVDVTRARVEQASEGKIGYLHIRGMDMPSFRRFEEDLYHAGVGKDGLIVDVRWNGGGSTADLLLTALTQPRHAITVPRGGGTGYPQDRKVYATWQKPIVAMCNEFSFSNAEIFSHAIKTLKRGPLVGMRSAGGVISTGAVGLVDGSMVRMPFRGWFLVGDGADMELNGCLPDLAEWNSPVGDDRQLLDAVAALRRSIAEQPADPRPVPGSSLRSRK